MITVHPPDATQWRELREIRLRALRDAPRAFLTTAAEMEAQPDDYWSNRAAKAARGDGWGIFLAYAESGEAVGMVAGVDDPKRPRVVELIQMWVDPSARGRSAGRSLVEAVMRWGALRADRMRLCVFTDNPTAIALYLRCGFAATGEEEPVEGRPGIGIRYFERPLSPSSSSPAS